MIEYPFGAIQKFSELKEGDKVYSVTFPHDATHSTNAVANTINLVPYIFIQINNFNATLELATDRSKRVNITLTYRNIRPDTERWMPEPDCKLWFLFKNYWHAYAYYRRYVDQQSMKTT